MATDLESVPLQRPVDDATPDAWDAIVVGAGPAGAMAARRLAAGGARTLLLDRRRFPRDKTCGDALIPDAQACLARNGLLDRVRAIGHRSAIGEVHSPWRRRIALPCETLTVPRRRLDALLAAAAVERGAEFAHGPVTAVEERGAAGVAVRVAGRAAPLVARVGILATGAHVALGESLGVVTRRRASAVAIRAYLRSTHALDRLLVSFDRSILPGYAWIFPCGGDGGATLYNVGCGIVLDPRDATGDDPSAGRGLREMLERFLGGFPEARALMAGLAAREPVRGAVLRTGLTGGRAWSGGRWLAAGETIGTTYPLTGEGIGKAMESAERASDAALAHLRGADGALADYPARLARELAPRYRGYALAERWVGHPRLAELVFRGAARRPRVRAAMAGILTETVDPERVFSWRGALRAVLG